MCYFSSEKDKFNVDLNGTYKYFHPLKVLMHKISVKNSNNKVSND